MKKLFVMSIALCLMIGVLCINTYADGEAVPCCDYDKHTYNSEPKKTTVIGSGAGEFTYEVYECIVCGAVGGNYAGVDWSFYVTDTTTGYGTLNVWKTSLPESERQTNPHTNLPYADGVIREGVKYSGKSAADTANPPWDTSKISKLILHEGVTVIGSFTFQNMPFEGELIIPSTVKYIGQDAFNGGGGGTRGTWSLPRINKLTFAKDANGNCAIKCIAGGAFKFLRLTEVELPEGLECTHIWLFTGCIDLTSISVPSTVKTCKGHNHVEYNSSGANYPFKGGEAAPGYGSSSGIADPANNASAQIKGKSTLQTMTFASEDVRDLYLSCPDNNDQIPATAGLTGYTSMQAAITAAAASENPQDCNVTLFTSTSVSTGQTLIIPEGVTLDLNGKTLTNSGTVINYGRIVSNGSPVEIGGNTPTTYTVTYDLDGGTVAGSNPTNYYKGIEDFTLINPTKPNYIFKGWSGSGLTGDGNKDVTVTSTTTGNLTFTANWFAITEITPDYTWYGNGSAAEYYLNDAADLLGFANIVNGKAPNIAKDTFLSKTVYLNDDIDLTNVVWTPIGSSMYDHSADDHSTKKFEGTFDGGSHTIIGLSSAGYTPLAEDAGPSKEYSFGLFGYAYGANIKNVKLADVSINCCTVTVDGRNVAGSGVAALIGYYVPKHNAVSVINNCHVLGGTVVASNNMGGLMGYMQVHGKNIKLDVTIKNCSNAANVTTMAREAGGILGLAQQMHYSNTGYLRFENCQNSGNITAKNGGSCSVAGGILGQENSSEVHGTMQIIFDACSNSGTITAESGNGVGEIHASGIGTAYYNNGPWLIAKNCTNTGSVIITGKSGSDFAAGIFAYAPFLTTEGCTNSGTVTIDGEVQTNTLVSKVYNELYLSDADKTGIAGSNYPSFILNGGTTPNVRVKTEDVWQFTTPDPVRPGYTLIGWYTDEEFTNEATSFSNGSMYYAKWEVNPYTVHFDPNGGTGAAMSSANFIYDKEDQALPANTYTREHFSFAGWNTAPDGSGAYFADQTVKPNVIGTQGEVTLYAQWKGDEYTITYDGIDGALLDNAPNIHTYNAPTVIPNPTKTNHIFAGWTINNAENKLADLTLGATDYTDNITLYANWTAKELVAVDTAAQTYTYDGSQKGFVVNATPADGYTVEYYIADAWTSSASTDAGSYDVRITRNEDVTYQSYEQVITGGLVIDETDPTFTAPTIKQGLVYSAEDHELINAGDVTVGGTLQYKLNDGEWSTNVPTAKDAGTYTVWYKVIGDTNYKDIAETGLSVTITPASLTVTAKDKTITYGDAPANNGVTFDGFVPGEDANVLGGTLTYTYSYTQYGNIGTYDIIPAGLESANYAITFTEGTLTISPKPVSEPTVNGTYTYTGSELTLDLNGFDDSIMSVTGNKATNAGRYTATVDLDSNYMWENSSQCTIIWTIQKAQAEITVDLTPIVVTYGDTVTLPNATSNFGTVSCAIPDMTNAGEHTVFYSVPDTVNYDGDSKTLSVTVAPKALTVIADSLEVKAFSAMPEFTYTVDGFVEGDSFETLPNFTTDADMKKAGTYTITPSGANAGSNYTITYVNGTLTVKNVAAPQPSYNVNISGSIANGTVKALNAPAKKNDTVVLAVTPNAGYELASIAVYGTNGSNCAVSSVTDDKYIFTMPGCDVYVYAEFRVTADSFADLDKNAWYYDSVTYCIEKGLMDGIGNNIFAPNNTTSRAMIVTILWRLEGCPVVNYLMRFEDVESEAWYTEAVRWAASEKIAEGYAYNLFGTGDDITREQFATILHRYAEYKGYDTDEGEQAEISDFDDAKNISTYAKTAMQWACSIGLIEGDGINLTPSADATRAQAAALFERFCKNVAE